MKRRELITGSLSFGAVALAERRLLASIAPSRSKSILVLGGTSYLGPQIVSAALKAGYQVTLFNRGITNPQLFPSLKKLRGFRSTDPKQQDLTSLRSCRWDAVVDVWPSAPSLASTAAELLHAGTQHYLYVSSIGAYDESHFAQAGTTEDASLGPYDGNENDYESGKAESERRLHEIVGRKLTVVRPGSIEGEHAGRRSAMITGKPCSGGGLLLTWLSRAQSGGRRIGPGDGSDPIQFVDIKDVASFVVQAIDRNIYGTYNLVEGSRTFKEHIAACKEATRSNAEFIWIPRVFLEAHGLGPAKVIGDGKPTPFTGWIPDPKIKGLYEISNVKALATGWRPRPFAATASDVLTPCLGNAPGTLDVIDTVSSAKEEEVLDAWARKSKL